MPAGTPLTPLGIPLGLTGLGALPEHKIKGSSFGVSHPNASTSLKIVQGTPGQLAVASELANCKIDVPVTCLICKPLLLQLLDKLEHLRNELRGPGLMGWREAS